MTGAPCFNDKYFGHDLCPLVPCSTDDQCVTNLCYEDLCREPLQPLVIFAVVSISLIVLFVLLGVVYLTSHQRRIQQEDQLRRQVEQRGQKVQELNVGVLKKNKFDLKSEIERSVNYNNETTLLLPEGAGDGSLLFDQDLD